MGKQEKRKEILWLNRWAIGSVGTFFMVLVLALLVILRQGDDQIENIPNEVDDTYFISETPITYIAFMPVNNQDQDFANNPVWIKLQEMTNIYFEFISPIGGEESEDMLKRLFASGDYPDLVLNSTAGYAGGYDKAILDGIYIDITPYLEANAPNYKKLIETYDDELSAVYTDSGKLPGFWEIYDPVESRPIIGGMMIREDMLETTGMSVPVTVDDWTNLLRQLQSLDGVDYPLIFGQQNGVNVTAEFLSAYGIGAAPISTMNGYDQLFYPVGDIIMYGAMEEGYRSYLQLMNQWYEEGLLDKDFAIRTFVDLFERSKMVSERQGAANWQYTEWLTMYKDEAGQQVAMVAAPMPKLNEEDEAVQWMVSRKPFTGKLIAITSACEDVEPLVRFFDFLYSEQGILLQNYGIEGDTFTMVDGEPVYSDKILTYPKGAFEGVGKYISNNAAVMYNLSYTSKVQSALYGEEVVAMKNTWYDTANLFTLDVDLSVEENTRLIRIMAPVTTYVTKFTVQAIIGGVSDIEWQEHLTMMRSLNVKEALSIIQEAYDRKAARVYEYNSEE